ncbi:MAG: dTDP-4-amino-4,6-dideoxygalactose transaminase [Polyangiaceae bacterium]
MSGPPIPFNRPGLMGGELARVTEALASGQISGCGALGRRCEEILSRVLGAPRTLLVTSCTHALEMAALLLDVRPGDEVIVPSFTFVSTVNAFVLRGAKPIFADVDRRTLGLDPAHVASLLSSRTKVVVPVHYAGIACDMDGLSSAMTGHAATLVEDNAHGLFGKYKGQSLGTFGAFSTLSFHETKNLTCGEGGALVINDLAFAERGEVVRDKGTQRARFFRGEIDKYTWCDLGSSYVLSEVLAAILLAQLEAREAIATKRRHLWTRYAAELADWAAKEGARLPFVPAYCEQPFHLFYVVMSSHERQQALIAHLAERGISAVFHYLPLHLSPMGLGYGGKPGDCPVTEMTSACLLRLPLFNGLTDEEQDRIIEGVLSFS